MAIPKLAADFREFLKLLGSNKVEYLLIGGYAVGIYGYVRATNDLDVWVRISPTNAMKLERALNEFGFKSAQAKLFLATGNVVRMGVPPMRIEILTTISGADFDACYSERSLVQMDGNAVAAFGGVARLIPEDVPAILEPLIDEGQSDVGAELERARAVFGAVAQAGGDGGADEHCVRLKLTDRLDGRSKSSIAARMSR